MSLPIYGNHKMPTLFPDQKKFVEEVNGWLEAGEKRILGFAPTAFGKTVAAGHILAPYIDRKQRALFMSPRLPLIDQTVNSFGRMGFAEHIGVIQQRHPLTNYRKLLQIASRDTILKKPMETLPKFDLVLIDECHMMTKGLEKFLQNLGDTPYVGFSATPWTPGLGRYYNHVVKAPSIAELIDLGRLCKFKVYAPSPEPDLKHVKTTGGDYNQGQLSDAVNKPQIVGDIVDQYEKLGQDLQALCYAVDRAHAKHISQRFNERGIPAEYVDCHTNDLERSEIFARYRRKETRIICNVGVLTTGFDAPETSCLIDAHPTRSEILHVQTIGRALRTAPGKDYAIILDHSGNSLRLGLVTQIVKDGLCDGSPESRAKAKKREKCEPLPRLCDDCKTVIPQHIDTCPQCGATKIKITKVRAADGELVEFGSGQNARTSATIEERARFYAELRQMGIDRGRKPGWAANTYKERFGVWPNDPRIRYAEPRRPSIATINFVRQRANEWREEQRRG